MTTTQTVLTDAQFDLALANTNLLSMNAIQQKYPLTVVISDYNENGDKWFKSLNDCIEDAHSNKGNLIGLLFHFEQAGEYNSCNPDCYWVAKIVASDSWTNKINATYWDKYWDGDFDNLRTTINQYYNEFYPLN